MTKIGGKGHNEHRAGARAAGVGGTAGEPGWRDYPPLGDGAQHTVAGTLKVLPGVESPQLGNRRDLYAYLPPSHAAGRRRYPVLYMHDGQNLFDDATSFGAEWRVDETMQEASRSGLEAIIVGIPNMGEDRIAEYSPFEDPKHGGGRADAYLDFILETVKPRVDRSFRTLPDSTHTGIAGSSMGGLVSLYGFFRRPEAFGFAGAMSPSFWFAGRAIFPFVEAAPAREGRIYLDVGTREGDQTVRDARQMRDLLHRKGYDAEHQLRYVEERGGGHTETAWARRLSKALDFLLPRR